MTQEVKENNKDNITIGLPKAGGAVYVAPAGTELPTNADDSLSEAFVNLGYISEDGFTDSKAEENNEVIAWGPETVMISSSSYTKTATFNLLETIRPSVLQFVYGKENVKINEDGSIAAAETGETLPHVVLVVETIQNNGSENPRFRREVLGDCQFVDRSGDQTYNNSDAVTYPVTVRAFKFDSKAIEGKRDYADIFWSKTAAE